jgi:hypothetical protein
MICAYLKPWAEGVLHRIDSLATRARLCARAAVIAGAIPPGPGNDHRIIYAPVNKVSLNHGNDDRNAHAFSYACVGAGALLMLTLWYQHVYVLPKVEYNRLHPYTSWIPITVWIVLRNMTPSMRTYSLGIYGWLGTITLETYISQFHTWLTTGIPDGQPKMLLSFLPAAEYPLLNFAMATASAHPLECPPACMWRLAKCPSEAQKSPWVCFCSAHSAWPLLPCLCLMGFCGGCISFSRWSDRRAIDA